MFLGSGELSIIKYVTKGTITYSINRPRKLVGEGVGEVLIMKAGALAEEPEVNENNSAETDEFGSRPGPNFPFDNLLGVGVRVKKRLENGNSGLHRAPLCMISRSPWVVEVILDERARCDPSRS
jgi:hypothetical protein